MDDDEVVTDIDRYEFDDDVVQKDKRIKIKIVKKDGTILNAVFSFYKLKKLKSLSLYQEANQGEDETLVHDWHMKTAPGMIIKYATDKQLAFVFTSSGSLAESFKLFHYATSILGNKKLFKEYSCYFDEVRFVGCLAAHHVTVKMLRDEYHFSESRIALLVKYEHKFNVLMQHGATLQQIKNMNPDLLAETDLYGVLKLVTLDQIMGINHNPPPAPKARFRYSENLTMQGKGKTLNGRCEIEFSKDHYDLKYHHKNSAKISALTIRSYTPDEKEKNLLDCGLQGNTPQQLIHDWYHLDDDRSEQTDGVIKKIYSPELNLVIAKKLSSDFPVKKVEHQLNSPLGINPIYYQELRFEHILQKHGCSLASFRKMPGMTVMKLKIMSDQCQFFIFLLKNGMALTDFARIDEDRLLFVFNESSSAKNALHYVKPAELFGFELKKVRPSSSGFFSQAFSEVNEFECSHAESSHAASSVSA